MSENQKKTGLQIAALGAVFVVLFVFRSELFQWFSLESNESQTSSRSHSNHSHGAPQHASSEAPNFVFPENEFAQVREVFTAAGAMGLALSKDQVSTLPASASKIKTALAALDVATIPSPIRTLLSDANKHAIRVAKHKTPEKARPVFAQLSEVLFQLAKIDGRLQEGWNVFSCPMTEGFPKWFQANETIENPYMGQKMLACGSSSEWGLPLAEDSPRVNQGEIAYYTCSMHPSVRQHSAGSCPICKMDLTAVTHEQLKTGDVLVDAVRRQRIGVRTAKVLMRPLLRTIRAVGQIAWDESRVHDVTARVDGWVEDLKVTRVGDPVEVNTELLRFYSPALLATQRELIAAPKDGRLAVSARERLRLWGMSNQAIRSLQRRGRPQQRVSILSPISGVVIDKQVNEGAHVTSGALLFRIADQKELWVIADVFEQDLRFLSTGQDVQVSLPHSNIPPQTGVIAYIYPSLDSDSRTGRIRIELKNSNGKMRPGMLAQLDFQIDLGSRLSVAVDSVIYTGTRRLVFVDHGQGRLRPTEVQIGARAGDWIIIESGLKNGDTVVRSGAFLLAAESRIRSATNYWEANDEAE